jgi:hypothetical protein
MKYNKQLNFDKSAYILRSVQNTGNPMWNFQYKFPGNNVLASMKFNWQRCYKYNFCFNKMYNIL